MIPRLAVIALFTLVAIRLPAEEPKLAQIRVACLGDSITAGAKVNAATESYPVQLQAMLGDHCVVKNFGVGGATMMRRGKPNAFQQLPKAKEFQPQVVIVGFGINDTRSRDVDYWNHFAAEFIPDATALIHEIAQWESHPLILLCLPITNYADLPGMKDERKQINAERVPRMKEVRAKLQQLAQDLAGQRVSVVDLETPTRGHPELYDVDGVHMKPPGYRLLAETLRPAVEKAAAQLEKAR